MATSHLPRRSADLTSILSLFVAWKAVLLLVVAASPGPGYDTSSQLMLFDQLDTSKDARGFVSRILLRLVRWDSVYFVNIAHRGYLYEQEWAFGRGFMFLTGQLAKVLPASFLPSPLLQQALAGSIIAHLAHALTCVFLYELTFRALPANARDRRQIARVAACLHVLSPAGIFLSAPYTESLFACLNSFGMLCLALTSEKSENFLGRVSHSLCFAAAGVSFALASTVRSNGVLSVLAFAVLCLPAVRGFLSQPFNGRDTSTLMSGAVGVAVTAVGTIAPQYVAYRYYCTGEVPYPRPWCSAMPPSIYSFVQKHYWGNGFLAYWTFSNSPLFLIAAPTLMLLFSTAYMILFGQWPLAITPPAGKKGSGESQGQTGGNGMVLRALAAPQLLLSVLCLTSFHVQIVNRISSGYPVWYIALAMFIVNKGERQVGNLTTPGLL
ncbi:mannosyltransferase-like protein 2 [Elsinoe australis]|uniref:GPI mannosyltransferase 2 n=1 Tax=Elsinoe australis TaxID=40998 RepID=A0A4U7B2P7_9PEZI|nr:mannosyltransferase-like protein 2 [Elsinoe australis]